MALKHPEINSTEWTAITEAGQEGSCWIHKNIAGTGGVLINHSSNGSPPTTRRGKRVNGARANGGEQLIGADNGSDVYYARVTEEGNRAILAVDVS